MRVIFLAILCLAQYTLCAQRPAIHWGEEFKISKGANDLVIFGSDASGIYLKESHLTLKSYFFVGMTTRESAMLVKVDKQFNLLYKNDYNRELRSKEFEQFQWVNGKLFLIASDYDKRERTMNLFAAEVDKNSGELTGEFNNIAAWTKEEKKDQLAFRVNVNEDSTRLIVVSMTTAAERNVYEVRTLSDKLQPIGKPVVLKTDYEANTYDLEDLIYTRQGTIALVGREYEFVEGKKKNSRNRLFKQYRIRLFGKEGKQLADFNTDVPGRWLLSAKLLEVGQELVLASFYSKEKRARTVEGMVVERFSPVDGHSIASTAKAINASAISEVETSAETDEGEEKDEESRKERKERERLEAMKDDGEGFSTNMRFHSFLTTADGGLVILAEKSTHYVVAQTVYVSGGSRGGGYSTVEYYDVFENNDIMMSKLAKDGSIAWLSILPKSQREVCPAQRTGSSLFTYFSIYDQGRPYFGGFSVVPQGNEVQLIFNDAVANAKVVKAGQQVRKVSKFGKTDCYALLLNTSTGAYQRRSLFSNRDQPTAMPRKGIVIDNTFYMVGREDRILGKTRVALASMPIKG